MTATGAPRSDFRLGEWLVRPSLATIERGGSTVHVTPRAMSVLVHLANARGEVVSRNQLLDAVWPGMSVTPDALSQCVVELRKAFHDDSKHPAVIQTIPKLGLRLLLDVAPATAGEVGSPQHGNWRIRLVGALVVASLVIGAALLWRARSDSDLRDPLAGADFKTITDFLGPEEHAAISPDGRFIAFISDRDGTWDVFVGPTGTGDFQNLTHGRIPDLRNPAVRMLDFSPDGAEVLIWSMKNRSWSIPVVGGELHTGPTGIAEANWSRDGTRLVSHPAAPGDPLFVTHADDPFDGRQIYVAPPGIHCHFPLWSHDGSTIYFVRGLVPDEMDIWQIRDDGSEPQRLTWHNSRVSFPTLIDERTMLYLATAEDGSGPWIHALDLQDRTTRRVKSASDAFTSLAATADGRRLVVTHSRPTAGLWSVRLSDGIAGPDAVTAIPIRTQRGVAPRFGRDSLVYRAPKAGTDALWKIEGSSEARELWSGREGRVIDGPVLSADSEHVAFTVQSGGRILLYTMNADGSGARRVAEQLEVRGAPAWSPDGKWIAIAALQDGEPRLFKIPQPEGPAVRLTDEYALDPVWSPSGKFLVYTAADVGTAFDVRAVDADGAPHVLPRLILTRGSRRLAFPGGDEHTLVFLKGPMEHKEFWAIDLRDGAQRALTNLGPGQVIGDFDVAADGSSIVFHRSQEESDIVLIELANDRR